MQALIFYKMGGLLLPAKIIGDIHEVNLDAPKQPLNEKNMDLWNNKIGRDIAKEAYKELKYKNLGERKNAKEFEDLVAEK